MLYSELIQEGRLAVEEIKALAFLIERRYGSNISGEVLIDYIKFMNDLKVEHRGRIELLNRLALTCNSG